jgi:hypothetical protein
MNKYIKVFLISFLFFGIILLLGLFIYYKYTNTPENKNSASLKNKTVPGKTETEKKLEFLNSLSKDISEERKEEIRQTQLEFLNSIKEDQKIKEEENLKTKEEKKKENQKKLNFLNSLSK